MLYYLFLLYSLWFVHLITFQGYAYDIIMTLGVTNVTM